LVLPPGPGDGGKILPFLADFEGFFTLKTAGGFCRFQPGVPGRPQLFGQKSL
jgi:hypothetical protein